MIHVLFIKIIIPSTFEGGKCNFIVFRQSIKFKIFAYGRNVHLFSMPPKNCFAII